MKKEYIFPITEFSNVEILNMICQSPNDDVDPWDEDYEEGGDGGHTATRCRDDYRSNSDFGSLW